MGVLLTKIAKLKSFQKNLLQKQAPIDSLRDQYKTILDLPEEDVVVNALSTVRKDVSFQFSARLEEVTKKIEKISISEATLTTDPVDAVFEAAYSDALSEKIRSSSYQEEILGLSESVQKKIDQLTFVYQKLCFVDLMQRSGLPEYLPHHHFVIDAFFEGMYREEGVFEKVIQAFITQVRQTKPVELFDLQMISSLNGGDEIYKPHTFYIEKNKKNGKISYRVLDLNNKLQQQALPFSEVQAILPLNEPLMDKHLVDKQLMQKLVVSAKHHKIAPDLAEVIRHVKRNFVKVHKAIFENLGQHVSSEADEYFSLTREAVFLCDQFVAKMHAAPDVMDALKTLYAEKQKTEMNRLVHMLHESAPFFYYHDFLKKIDLINRKIEFYDWNAIEYNLINNIGLTRSKRKRVIDVIHARYKEIVAQVKFTLDKTEESYKSCFSFFPIELQVGVNMKRVCLVAMSGTSSKLDGEKQKTNKQAMEAMHEKLKDFSKKLKSLEVDGKQYDLVYVSVEQESLDFLLQQMNKALSGSSKALKSYEAEQNLELLDDPFRGCAEKKFLKYMSDVMENPEITSFSVLGAANFMMPLVLKSDVLPSHEQYLVTCTEKASSRVLKRERCEFALMLLKERLQFVKTFGSSASINIDEKLRASFHEIDKYADTSIRWSGILNDQQKVIPADKLEKIIKSQILTLEDSHGLICSTPREQYPVGLIPCCTSCTALKLPVLTWLADMSLQKVQARPSDGNDNNRNILKFPH